MATFSRPDAFKEHSQYVPLLKKALMTVKPDAPKKFLYYKDYPFGAKKFPLVLVDYDVNCPKAILNAGHKPLFEGLVSLTTADELDFDATKDGFKRIPLKKYFATMGGGIKAVFVSPDEVEEANKDASSKASQSSQTTSSGEPADSGSTTDKTTNPTTQKEIAHTGKSADTARTSSSPDLKKSQDPQQAELRTIAASLKDLKVAVETLGPTANNKAEVDAQWKAAITALQKSDLTNAKAAYTKLQTALAQAMPTLPSEPTQPSTSAAPKRPAAPLPQQPAPTRISSVTAVDVAGQKRVHSRAAASIADTAAIASAVAKKAFGKGSATSAAKQLTPKFVTGRGKSVAKLDSKIEATYDTYVAQAPTDNARNGRADTVKKEAQAAKNLQSALSKVESAGKTGPTEADLDMLAQNCDAAVASFSGRLSKDYRNITTALRNAEEAGEKGKIKVETAKLKALMGGPDLERLATAYDIALETKLRKNSGVANQLASAMAEVEKSKTEDNLKILCALARKYADLFTEHASNYEQWPGLKRPSEFVKLEKFAEDTLQEAELTLFNLQQAKLGTPPWPADKQAEAISLGEKARELKAVDVLGQGKSFRPSGGTSDVRVLKNSKGKIEFAFKSAKGETSTMGLQPGGGAIREAISSKVSDAVLEQTGYDFGFPKATVANINGKVGALIEGIQGRELPAADKIKPGSKEANEVAEFQNKVPGKELQKVVMCGIVTGNILDLKWDNIFWEGEGANAKARPFDAGASFLPTKELKYQINNRPSGSGLNVPLLKDVNDQTVPGAQEPMDPEMVAAILKIDARAMRQTIEAERARHQASGLDKCLDDESLDNGFKSLVYAQKVLAKKRDNPLTLEQFLTEFGQDIAALYPP